MDGYSSDYFFSSSSSCFLLRFNLGFSKLLVNSFTTFYFFPPPELTAGRAVTLNFGRISCSFSGLGIFGGVSSAFSEGIFVVSRGYFVVNFCLNYSGIFTEPSAVARDYEISPVGESKLEPIESSTRDSLGT